MSDEPSRSPRRRLRVALAWGAGVAAALAALTLAVALIYASTPRGLQQLWLPLAERALDAEVTARAGRFALLEGRLELRGLHVDGEALAGEAAHLVVDLDLLAVPPWRRPRIETLRADVAKLVLRPSAEEEEPEPEAPGEGLPPALRPIPVRIDHASLREVVVEAWGAAPAASGTGAGPPAEDTLLWRVHLARAEILDVRPGSSGRAALEASWEVPPADPDVRTGALDLEVDLREPERRDAPPASADLALRLGARAGPRPDAPPRLRAAARGGGVLRPDGSVELRGLEAEAFAGRRRLAGLRADGVWRPADGTAGLDLVLEASPLAPLLARAALPARLADPLAPAGAVLRARVALGEEIAVRASGRVEELAPTPGAPAALALAVDARLDEEVLELAEVTLRGLDAAGGEAGRVAADGALHLEDALRADLALRARAWPLRPWLQRFGTTLPQGLAPLGLDADLALEGGAEAIEAAGQGRLHMAEAAPGGGPVDLHVDRLEVSAAPQRGSARASFEGRGPGRGARDEGRFAADVAYEPAEPRPRLVLEAALRGLDLGFVDAVRGEPADEGAPAEPEPAQAEQAGGGPLLALPLDVDATLELADLAYRELRIGEAGVEARAAGEDLILRVAGEEVSRGDVALDYARVREADRVAVRWALDLSDVDLVPILASFTSGPQRLGGTLGIQSEGAGSAPASEADLIASGDGMLRFQIRDGRAEGTRVQAVVAQQAGIRDFLTLRVAQASGELPIEGGVLRLPGVQVDGNLVHFRIDGAVDPETIDVRVNPRLGPDLAAGYGLKNVLFAPVSSLVALPFVVTVQGPLQEPAIGVRPATPALLGDVVGVAAGALEGMAGGARALLGVDAAPPSEATPSAPPDEGDEEPTEGPAAPSPAPSP